MESELLYVPSGIVENSYPANGPTVTVLPLRAEPAKLNEVGSLVVFTQIFPKPGKDADPICTKCPTDDERFNKKIIGMEIVKGLTKEDDEYQGGSILDPEVGKVYRCKIWLDKEELKVRGYLGPFYRTQTWQRVP